MLLKGHRIQQQMSRKRFFEYLKVKLQQDFDPTENLILVGDFNVTLQNIDRNTISNSTYKCHSAETLSSLVAHIGLEDSWRIANPSEREYTRMGMQGKLRRQT